MSKLKRGSSFILPIVLIFTIIAIVLGGEGQTKNKGDAQDSPIFRNSLDQAIEEMEQRSNRPILMRNRSKTYSIPGQIILAGTGFCLSGVNVALTPIDSQEKGSDDNAVDVHAAPMRNTIDLFTCSHTCAGGHTCFDSLTCFSYPTCGFTCGITCRITCIYCRPRENALLQNYPNPFNSDTWIPYELAEPAMVIIRIYNMKGQLVCTLDLGRKEIGSYRSQKYAAYWDGRNNNGEPAARGVHFYQIQAGKFSATRKMLMVLPL